MTQRQFTLLPYVADAAEPSVNEPEAAVKVPPHFLVYLEQTDPPKNVDVRNSVAGSHVGWHRKLPLPS